MRTTAHGLAVGTKVRVTGAPRRHARGTVTRIFEGRLEYRSDGDCSLRLVPIAAVHVRRKSRTRRYEIALDFPIAGIVDALNEAQAIVDGRR